MTRPISSRVRQALLPFAHASAVQKASGVGDRLQRRGDAVARLTPLSSRDSGYRRFVGAGPADRVPGYGGVMNKLAALGYVFVFKIIELIIFVVGVVPWL